MKYVCNCGWQGERVLFSMLAKGPEFICPECQQEAKPFDTGKYCSLRKQLDNLPLQQALNQVKEFMQATGQVVNEQPTMLDMDTKDLRIELICEELDKLREAMTTGVSHVLTADALADLLYVVLGTAVSCGIPVGEVFEEVHRSNMTKVISSFDPRHVPPEGSRWVDHGEYASIIRDDGKILEPEGYEPPRIKETLDRYEK